MPAGAGWWEHASVVLDVIVLGVSGLNMLGAWMLRDHDTKRVVTEHTKQLDYINGKRSEDMGYVQTKVGGMEVTLAEHGKAIEYHDREIAALSRRQDGR